jgi:hypothetical protein
LTVARIIVLDTGPLGLAATSPNNNAKAAACQAWLTTIRATGAWIVIPAVTDFEVRRELVRVGLVPSIARLDTIKARYTYLTPSEEAWEMAAELWALVRNAGVPTAGPKDLDADTIIAGQALTVSQPGDDVTIASDNVRHMHRFPGIDARDWPTIT